MPSNAAGDTSPARGGLGRVSLPVAGAVAAGTTTEGNVLAREFDSPGAVVCIEDTREMDLSERNVNYPVTRLLSPEEEKAIAQRHNEHFTRPT